jgi:phosphatidate cytidylyltransferase
LLQRTVTALVGLPVILAAIWWGSPWLTILVLLVAVQGIREVYRLLPPGTGALPVTLGALWVVALVLGSQAASGINNFLIISASILAVGSFVGLLWLVAYYTGGRYLTAVVYLIGGPVFAGFLLSHTLVLRNIGESNDVGRDWLLLTLLVIFANDTGAFLVGRILGRHRMAPSVSPGKTWEGAAGGLVWAVVAVVVLGFLFDVSPPGWQLAVIGATVGVLSQWGDLLESKVKRVANVKDAGSIIPGHGGVLDRLDSVVMSIPAVYYLLVTVFEP